jgi:hypothetical protein
MSDFERDLSKSAAAFKDVVWPSMQAVFKGELMPIESIKDSSVAKLIDMRSGIDAFHLSENNSIRGMACRVQFLEPGKGFFKTFTIRRTRPSGALTEYAKRKNDIESNSGWLYPYLTVQGYVTKGESPSLIAAAITKTEALIDACKQIESGFADKSAGRINVNPTKETFYSINWDWLEKNNKPLRVFYPGEI